MSPCHSGDSYNKSCHKFDKREGDRCLSDALGKHLSGLSPGVCDGLQLQWEDGKPGELDPSDYDEIVTTKEAETTDAFSSRVIHGKTKTAHRGEGINVITQALCAEEGSLPQGLMIQNVYMELCSGSKNITVVVRNSTACPQMLRRKTPVARAVMITQIPELPGLMEVSEEEHGHQMPKLTVKQRQEKLFEELDLS